MRPYLIGLTGPAGAGKDTVAMLVAGGLQGTRTMAFADALRNQVSEAFNVPLHVLTDREGKETPTHALSLNRCWDMAFIQVIRQKLAGPTGMIDLCEPRSPRQIMQWWGTEYRRARNPNYWVELAAMAIERSYPTPRLVILTDVRFPNEALLVRQHRGQIWQITRPGCEATGAHVSDVAGHQFQPDRQIHNHTDLQGLASTLTQHVRHLHDTLENRRHAA